MPETGSGSVVARVDPDRRKELLQVAREQVQSSTASGTIRAARTLEQELQGIGFVQRVRLSSSEHFFPNA